MALQVAFRGIDESHVLNSMLDTRYRYRIAIACYRYRVIGTGMAYYLVLFPPDHPRYSMLACMVLFVLSYYWYCTSPS